MHEQHGQPKRRRVLPPDIAGSNLKLWLRSDLGVTLVADPVIGAWTLAAGWTAAGGGVYSHAGAADNLSQAILVVGNAYRVTYTVSGVSGGTIRPYAGTTAGTSRAADGTYTEVLVCAGNTSMIFVGNGTASVGAISIESLSVSGWADQSGAGNHATQSTAIRQLAFRSDLGPNGLPAVDFVTTSRFMELAVLNTGTSNTCFFVYTLRSAATQGGLMDAPTGRLIMLGSDYSGKLGFYDGAYRIAAAATLATQSATFVFNGAGGTSEVYRDGVSIATPAFTSKALGGAVKLGGSVGGGVLSADALLMEVAVWSKLLSSDELTLLHEWSNARYSL